MVVNFKEKKEKKTLWIENKPKKYLGRKAEWFFYCHLHSLILFAASTFQTTKPSRVSSFRSSIPFRSTQLCLRTAFSVNEAKSFPPLIKHNFSSIFEAHPPPLLSNDFLRRSWNPRLVFLLLQKFLIISPRGWSCVVERFGGGASYVFPIRLYSFKRKFVVYLSDGNGFLSQAFLTQICLIKLIVFLFSSSPCFQSLIVSCWRKLCYSRQERITIAITKSESKLDEIVINSEKWRKLSVREKWNIHRIARRSS